MTAKADWGATAVASPSVAPEVDPFDAASSCDMTPMPSHMMKPASADRPLDLSTPEPELRSWLVELVRREGNLWNCGTTCPLKDREDTTCTACPVSRARDTDEGTLDEERLKRLCMIGEEQERVSMVLLSKRHRGG